MASPPQNESKSSLAPSPPGHRRQAEARLKQAQGAAPLEGDPLRALHELRVHQIELEMQNEELRRTHVELDTVRARYFDLYELAPVGYCTLNEAGLILEANLTAVTMLGSTRVAMLNQSLLRFVVREDHAVVRALLSPAPGGAARRTAEVRFARSDATRFWAELVVSAEAAGSGARRLRVVLSDVTARKTAEEARREGETRYRDLFSRATNGIVLCTLDGTVVEANEAFARLHGCTLEALTGSKLETYDTGRVALSAEHTERLERGERLTVELEHRDQAGQPLTLEASFSRVLVSGSPRVLLFYRDVSARKRLHAALAQTDRLASMGMLAAGVAHEVNNPLTYLMSNLESVVADLPHLAASSPASLADLVERATAALEGAGRIKTISRSLSAFARVERVEVEPVDLNRALRRAADMANNELKHRARLITQLGRLPPVQASEGRLTQVFLNLIINAVQSIEEGHVAEHTISLRTWATGDQVFAEIGDTGHGMSPETMARIFEPFFTTKATGSGLGLAICKSIMTELGGDLSVQSTLGEGTRFVARLTAGPPVRALSEDQVSAPVEPAARRGRILLVDDEPAIRRVIHRLLGKDHEVLVAASGREAQALLEGDKAFDLILCDLMMPEMTGMELHAWLAGSAPALARRVVFISGGAFTPNAAAYLEALDNVELRKPFGEAELKRLVASMLSPAASAPAP